MFINIYSQGRYPANALSNFAPHKFDFDGFNNIPCMEAFLQSLKFEDITKQKQVLYMNAKDAKKTGSQKNWDRYLFWKGQKIDRHSQEYNQLVERAYRKLLMNDDFRQALINTKRKILIHSIGKFSRKKTVLTWWEFVRILTKLRKEINAK